MKKQTGLIWIWVSIAAVVLDQLSKGLALKHLSFNQPMPILPVLNFTLRFNRGAAFSFLGSESGWQVYLLAAFSVIVSIALVVWLARTPRHYWARCLGLSLIIGGAMGNFVDRVRLTYVIDFVDFHVGTWHFATFNVADTFVSVGAAFLILGMLFSRRVG